MFGGEGGSNLGGVSDLSRVIMQKRELKKDPDIDLLLDFFLHFRRLFLGDLLLRFSTLPFAS